MVSIILIVFREALELALILSIVLAVTRGLAGSHTWIVLGAACGTLGAVGVAMLTGEIAEATSGSGQEIFNATVLFLAAGMLAWTVIWMRRHGREIGLRLKRLGQSVVSGDLPLRSLAVVVGLAVLREGSEIVVLLYGSAMATQSGLPAVLTGSGIGLLLGFGVGLLLYFGLLSIPSRYLFMVTGWLLIFLTAGMAAQGMGYLVALHAIPPLGDPLWDTSATLSEQSIPGQFLHVLLGYIDRPAGIQVLTYAATLSLAAFWMRRQAGD